MKTFKQHIKEGEDKKPMPEDKAEALKLATS